MVPRKVLMLFSRLFVITTVLMTSIPGAAAPQVLKGSRDNRQKLEQLILIVRDAERMATSADVRGELKQARRAIEDAAAALKDGTGDQRDERASAGEVSRARDLLRHIVDDPRGEDANFQEKVAEALTIIEESAATILGDGTSRATTETGFGLSTATFDTLQGTVTANLPDDLMAGDTISGTVVAEPKGQ